MIYTNNRDAYREIFFMAWDKYRKQLPCNEMETTLIQVILLHPEYHAILQKPQQYQTQEFTLEENPFMHMSLHLALLEQIQLDRPNGIKKIYQALLKNADNEHSVMHQMMACLSKILWQAQQQGEMPQEEKYLEMLRAL